MHAALYRMGELELLSHEVHVEASEHVRHVASQAPHVWPLLCKYCPVGHEYVHVPASLSKVAPSKQAVHPLAVPSEHSSHEISHGWQMLSASEYLPLGQVATQVPSS